MNSHFYNGELQHSQWGVRHFRKVIETAARHQLMIVNHEGAMPSGIQRTWPNLIGTESMRGQEYNAFDRRGGNPPYHECVLPFTRGLGGPMDFLPASLSTATTPFPAHARRRRSPISWLNILSSTVLAGHDVEDHLVGGAHGVGADDGEVADAAVDVVVDDALGAGDVAAFHGEDGAEQGGGDA